MTTTRSGFTVINSVADAEENTQEPRAPRGFAAWLAVFLAIATGMSAWLAVSTGVPDVSAVSAVAASSVAQPTPQVAYFPSLYVNQATHVETAPPTF